jgi:hypothetical protein
MASLSLGLATVSQGFAPGLEDLQGVRRATGKEEAEGGQRGREAGGGKRRKEREERIERKMENEGRGRGKGNHTL